MEKLPNIHPGEILLEEFLKPMDISAYRLAKETGIPQTRVSQIIKAQRRITADTAIRLSYFFGNSVKFWLGIQDDYDVRVQLSEKQAEFSNIKQYSLQHQLPALEDCRLGQKEIIERKIITGCSALTIGDSFLNE